MNHKQATVKFSLNVHSSNTGEVWPMEARDNPKLDERIRESYYADEDDAAVGFDIEGIEDLMEILKFYAGRSVHISLGVTVETPELSTHAMLCEKWQRGTSASFRALETEDLSPATAASKMIAIAHALSRWEKKNPLPNASPRAPAEEELPIPTNMSEISNKPDSPQMAGCQQEPCSLSSECVLKRDLKGRLGILSAPPIFLCTRESIEDLIARHNELLRQLDDARQATRQWIEAWDRYGDGASLMHPRLTMAITTARKSLPENV